MKIKKFFTAVIFFTGFISSVCFAGDSDGSGLSRNVMRMEETAVQTGGKNENQDLQVASLDKQLKKALVNSDHTEAARLKEEIMRKYQSMNIEVMVPQPVALTTLPDDPDQTDWMSTNAMITAGFINHSTPMHRLIDIEAGEDGYLYAVVNAVPGSGTNGAFRIFKSNDGGRNWSNIIGVGTGNYIGNLAISVDSRNDNNHDSTRITVYYTASFNADYKDAKLNYYSITAASSGINSGIIATPASGKTISYISTVSDGAFYQNYTYYGVVFTEEDNITGETFLTRFLRTTDWGATWIGASISGLNDKYPSVDYKPGPTDSIYIAVERVFTPGFSDIRVFSMPWSPASVSNIYYLTNGGSNIRYEKPDLTVKQNDPCDSILITCTRNGYPVYNFTPNAGASWFIDYNISVSNGSNKIYTSCSSSPAGPDPFSVCWLSNDGDSLNVRRGLLGFMGNTVFKINQFSSFTDAAPVCITFRSAGKNTTAVIYASATGGTYCTQEGLKNMTIKIIPEGFYNDVTNTLSMSDTLRLYVRTNVAPFAIVDSSISVLNDVTQTADFSFNDLSDGIYMISLKHRNTVETWGSLPVSLVITGNNDYNFTVSASTAFGDNQVKVDDSPVKYAIYSGDLNDDDNVNLTDIVETYNDASAFITGYVNSDFSGNSHTDLADIVIVYNNSAKFITSIAP